MAQRVRIPYRGHSPSSAIQLPILAALHAGFPTLLNASIQENGRFVKGEHRKFGNFQTTEQKTVSIMLNAKC